MLELDESIVGPCAEDVAGALPRFPEKLIRLKNRKHSSSFSHSGNNGLTVNGFPYSQDHLAAAFHKVDLGSGLSQLPAERKNSRKSRNGFKKFGGSKDIYFRTNDEMADYSFDKHDPEYDSGEEEDPLAFAFEKPLIISSIVFETVFVNMVKEFFEHVRPEEVLASLRELEVSEFQKSTMPYLAILTAMPHKTAKCEITSELLTFLSSRYITHNHIQQGFLKLLCDLPDISLDIPKAPQQLGCFIARAIADGILSKSFLLGENEQINDLVSEISDALQTSHSPPISAPVSGLTKKSLRTYSGDHNLSSGVSSASVSLGASLNGSASTGLTPAFELSSHAQESMRVAELMLQDAKNSVKLQGIWGRHCGLRATRELIKDIQNILTEYMVNKDISDTEMAIRTLDAPHFHHEVIYQAILTAIETGTDDGIEQIVLMVKELCESVIVSYDQLCRGVKRVYAEMPLLQKEIPLAYSLLNRFIERSVISGFFPLELSQERPSKARKRYVSEGDYLHRS